jgi:nucleoside-diphosphate-sugar epimerase
MQKIFITGATGLVGSYILKAFVEKGYVVKALKRPHSDTSWVGEYNKQITWLDGDILDIVSLEQHIEAGDIVVHAAALVSFQKKDKRQMFKVNVEGTANIVNVCLEKNIKKFIYISSIASLGRKKGQVEIDEESKWEDSELNTLYAESKYLAEIEVWRGVSEGLKAVILNPSLVFGAGDWSRTSLQLFKYVDDGKKMYPIGSMNYVDVRDIATIALQMAENDVHSERFVISAGNLSYKELFEKIATKMGKKAPTIPVTPLLAEIAWRVSAFIAFFTRKSPLISKETARVSQMHFVYQNHKIKQFLPGFQFKTLEETLDWVIANKKSLE